jgi:acyl-CoA oxidase
MGKFSNYAIVYARLVIEGKNYGVQPFMVQTRNVQNWELLPGIETGDIGPKFGYNSKDNAYMSFNHVRIPRTNIVNYPFY